MIDVLILQGTAPSYEFEFEDENEKLVIATNKIKEMTVVFYQKKSDHEIKKEYVSEGSENSIKFEGNIAIVSLTPDETFKFIPGFEVEIQMRLVLNEGQILMSDKYRGRVEATLFKKEEKPNEN